MTNQIDRRTFLVAGGLTAGVAAIGLSTPGQASASPKPPKLPRTVLGGLRYWAPPTRHTDDIVTTDVFVYGGTSAGVTAAVQAHREGKTVALATFNSYLGGLTASGLGHSDIGNANSIGGLAREFYTRIGTAYAQPGMLFNFEPHVAADTFEAFATENSVAVYRDQHLASVRTSGGRLVEAVMDDGRRYRAKVFVDASYEGDLVGAAGVTYTVGRESNSVYGEQYNGIQFGNGDNQFLVPVDPYVRTGQPRSGLLPGISAGPPGTSGNGDKLVQAYNFRLCLSNAPDRAPYDEPDGYDPRRYALLLRYIEAGVFDVFGNTVAVGPNHFDMNNNGAVATDDIGANAGWPEGDYLARERIFQEHVAYQAGLLYFLATDSDVPRAVRDYTRQYGITNDEFAATSGWSHELYVREGRRLVSDYVMTEHNSLGNTTAPDSIALASYVMDSHNTRRIVVDGHVTNEGNVQVHIPGPFPISYRAVTPKSGECANLLVAGALSASHVAFGSLRLEPVFMMVGQAIGSAAASAIDAGVAVQNVDYADLRTRLLAGSAILQWPAS
ncbi:MAG TPA: FAD-dependent oxidoreductase [Jatrophihabitantaceae bacterium]